MVPFFDNKDNEGAIQSSYMNITDNSMNATNATTADMDIPYDDFVAENETEKGGEY